MHRSGTSAATRLVNLLGLSTCIEEDLLNDQRGNAKGHWESISMVALNEHLLTEMGRAWWCPPRTGAAYELDLSRVSSDPAEARKAFGAVHRAEPWVWKDPRTSLTLPFWREALGAPLACLVVWRNPLDVAASLHARDRLAISHGVALWERYNRLILSHVAELPVHLSCYDDIVADPVRWCESVAGFLESCGISWSGVIDGDKIRSFVDAELRHSRQGWLEFLSDYSASAVVHDALETSVGAWASFESPDLPGEAPWVEAEFVAIGSWQPVRLPAPAETTVTVIVASLGVPPEGEVDHLAARLLPFTEAIVVTDALAPECESPPAHGVQVVRVAPGTPLGAARMAALEYAKGDLIDFRAPGAALSDGWLPNMRRAFASGYAAVSPGVTAPSGGGGYGLTWSSRLLSSRWCARPADGLETIPLLAGACFAVQRAALEAVGGFDPQLGAYGLDSHELSLRMWRLGHRCAAARDAVATVPEPALFGQDPATVDWGSFVFDLLRLGATHLAVDDLAALTAGVVDRPGAAAAIARVLASGPFPRLEERGGNRPASSEAFFEWFGIPRASACSPARGAGHVPQAGSASVGRASQSTVAHKLLSVIVASREGLPTASYIELVARELPTGTEILVADDRCSGAARASGDLLMFLDADAEPAPGWAAPLISTAAGEAIGAVGPSLLPHRRHQQPVAGLTFSPRFGDFRWRHVGEQAEAEPVPVLGRSCVVIRHDVYRAIGGYDPDLEQAAEWAEAELCLRLWRAGYRCVAVPSSVLTISGWWEGKPPCWDDVLHGALRVAAVHLDEGDHLSVLERLRQQRGFAAAIARVAAGDAGRRRADIAARSQASAGAVLRQLCGADLFDA